MVLHPVSCKHYQYVNKWTRGKCELTGNCCPCQRWCTTKHIIEFYGSLKKCKKYQEYDDDKK